MEVEPTSFPLSRRSSSLCVLNPVYFSEPTCAQLTTRAPELNLNKVTPWLASRGPEDSHVMVDEDGEKRARFFKDKKKKRERQLKERKKRLDGSDSEEKEDGEDGRRRPN